MKCNDGHKTRLAEKKNKSKPELIQEPLLFRRPTSASRRRAAAACSARCGTAGLSGTCCRACCTTSPVSRPGPCPCPCPSDRRTPCPSCVSVKSPFWPCRICEGEMRVALACGCRRSLIALPDCGYGYVELVGDGLEGLAACYALGRPSKLFVRTSDPSVSRTWHNKVINKSNMR